MEKGTDVEFSSILQAIKAILEKSVIPLETTDLSLREIRVLESILEKLEPREIRALLKLAMEKLEGVAQEAREHIGKREKTLESMGLLGDIAPKTDFFDLEQRVESEIFSRQKIHVSQGIYSTDKKKNTRKIFGWFNTKIDGAYVMSVDEIAGLLLYYQYIKLLNPVTLDSRLDAIELAKGSAASRKMLKGYYEQMLSLSQLQGILLKLNEIKKEKGKATKAEIVQAFITKNRGKIMLADLVGNKGLRQSTLAKYGTRASKLLKNVEKIRKRLQRNEKIISRYNIKEMIKPHALSEIYDQEELIKELQSQIKFGSFTNWIWAGPSRTGKTLTADAFINDLADYYGFNRGDISKWYDCKTDQRYFIQFMKDFGSTMALTAYGSDVTYKIVVLNEADQFTKNTFDKMKEFLENLGKTRVILICIMITNKTVEFLQPPDEVKRLTKRAFANGDLEMDIPWENNKPKENLALLTSQDKELSREVNAIWDEKGLVSVAILNRCNTYEFNIFDHDDYIEYTRDHIIPELENLSLDLALTDAEIESVAFNSANIEDFMNRLSRARVEKLSRGNLVDFIHARASFKQAIADLVGLLGSDPGLAG